MISPNFFNKRIAVIILPVLLAIASQSYSQDKFVYTENGLSPESISQQIEDTSKLDLQSTSLVWIKNYLDHDNKLIELKDQDNLIIFTGLKENAVNEGKLYFHIQYTVKIAFENNQYSFKPLKVQLKANSKYDMGWKDFNLNNGALYFKKGKAMKKYRSHIKNIPDLLNNLNSSLYSHLESSK